MSKSISADGSAGAPGTVLGTDTVDLADIASVVQGNYLTQTLFNPPVQVTGDYFFGFDKIGQATCTSWILKNTLLLSEKNTHLN